LEDDRTSQTLKEVSGIDEGKFIYCAANIDFRDYLMYGLPEDLGGSTSGDTRCQLCQNEDVCPMP
jgi:hypothetical protein